MDAHHALDLTKRALEGYLRQGGTVRGSTCEVGRYIDGQYM